MALLFGGAADARVTIAADTTLNSLDTFTYLAWIYPTASTLVGGIITKGTGGGSNRRSFELASGSGAAADSLLATVDLSVTDAVSNSAASQIAQNTWQCVAMSFDVASPTIDLYHGTLTSPAAEVTYNTETTGSGTTSSNASDDQYIGVFGAGTSGSVAQRIGPVAIFNRVLTLAEIRRWQFNPFPFSGCVLMMHLGYDGTGTQRDLSGNGNTGTVTTATVAPHVPTRYPAVGALVSVVGTTPPASSGNPWYHYMQQQLLHG